MKKLFLFPLVLLCFTACSTDWTGEAQQEQTLIVTELQDSSESRFIAGKCFKSISAHVDIDLSEGLNNPLLLFTADTPAGIPFAEQYIVSVELQPLADCEDMDSKLGNSLIYTYETAFYNISVNPPVIQVTPSQLPNTCYKWRMIFERVTATQRISSCQSATEWYDMPLY